MTTATLDPKRRSRSPKPTTRQRNNRPRNVGTRQNSLNREVWVRWLEAQVLQETDHPNDPMRAGGSPLRESDQRALYRWRREGWCPDLFTADTFCIRYLGQPIDVFLRFCDEADLNPWQAGHPPAWYDRDDWEEDLQSSDFQWRREAAQERRSRRRDVAA